MCVLKTIVYFFKIEKGYICLEGMPHMLCKKIYFFHLFILISVLLELSNQNIRCKYDINT